MKKKTTKTIYKYFLRGCYKERVKNSLCKLHEDNIINYLNEGSMDYAFF